VRYEPLFLTLDEVLQLHSYQIAEHHGSDAILNLDNIGSAIAQPRQAFGGQFVHDSLEAMAAAYLYHLVKNHGFEDGNKRTGMHAALVFLELNGYELDVPVDEAEDLTVRVATGEATKEEVTAFFHKLMQD
jgi:death on curing protein